MKVLVASRAGNCLSLSQRIEKEGHIPYFRPLDKHSLSIGEGIAQKDTTLNKKFDLSIFDEARHGKLADTFSCPVVGACRWADHADTNEEYSRQILHLGKVNTCKEIPKNAIVVDCQIWWDGFESHFHSIAMSEDRLMNGDIGPRVDGAGITMRMVHKDSKIVRETASKLENILKKTSYRGPITIRTCVTKEDISALRLFAHINYLPNFSELYKGELTKLFHGIAVGSNGYANFMKDYSISVLVSIPPYPHICVKQTYSPKRIEGLNDPNLKHIWLHDVKKEEGHFVTGGNTGRVMTIAARGRDIIECRRRVYRTLSNINIPYMQYRTDIGWKFEDDEKLLRRWGYI